MELREKFKTHMQDEIWGKTEENYKKNYLLLKCKYEKIFNL